MRGTQISVQRIEIRWGGGRTGSHRHHGKSGFRHWEALGAPFCYGEQTGTGAALTADGRGNLDISGTGRGETAGPRALKFRKNVEEQHASVTKCLDCPAKSIRVLDEGVQVCPRV